MSGLAFRSVGGFPNSDLILKPSLGVCPVIASCMTMYKSDLSLSPLDNVLEKHLIFGQHVLFLNSSNCGIAKDAFFEASLIAFSNSVACTSNSFRPISITPYPFALI